MSDTQSFSLNIDTSPLNTALDTASSALSNFANGPVADMSKSVQAAVNGFGAMASTIADAALSGSTSISQMVDEMLADFDRVSLKDFILKPIEGIVSSGASSLFSSVSGALATGGPVTPDASYLVGEQGPELFTPSGAGTITSNAALSQTPARPSITLNVNARDAQSFAKSETQLAAMMSRALARGQRNM
jgi:phage-related minor tail protein